MIVEGECVDQHAAESSDLYLCTIDPDPLGEFLEQASLATQFGCQVCVHEFRVVGSSVGRTLPFALLSVIAGDNVHAGSIDVKLEKRMLCIALDHVEACKSCTNFW